jgi:hypothetical protein
MPNRPGFFAVMATAAALFAAAPAASEVMRIGSDTYLVGDLLPTGQRITPLAAPGATFKPLNPNLEALPDFVAGQAVEIAVSPDGRTMLALTSGYNRNYGADGKPVPALLKEYVFVFDISVC